MRITLIQRKTRRIAKTILSLGDPMCCGSDGRTFKVVKHRDRLAMRQNSRMLLWCVLFMITGKVTDFAIVARWDL